MPPAHSESQPVSKTSVEMCARPQQEEDRAAEETMGTVSPAPFVMEQPDTPENGRGVTLECWSLAHESDLEQIERVVAHFVSILEREGATLPENFRIVGPCRE